MHVFKGRLINEYRVRIMNNSNETKVSRRDILAGSMVVASGLSLGLHRSAVWAADLGKAAPKGAKIDYLAVYPAIGISRIGNSSEFFIAPEVPG